jgi:hypothetical protein
MSTDDHNTNNTKPTAAPKPLQTQQWRYETDRHAGTPRPEDGFKGISPETHVPVYHGVRATDFIQSMDRKEDSFGSIMPKEKPRKDPPAMLVHPASQGNPSATSEVFVDTDHLKHLRLYAKSIQKALTQEAGARGFRQSVLSATVTLEEANDGVDLHLTSGLKQMVKMGLAPEHYSISQDDAGHEIATIHAADLDALRATVNSLLTKSPTLNNNFDPEKTNQR